MEKAFLIDTKSDGYYGHVNVRIVNLKDGGKVRNITSHWDVKPTEFYEGLMITCQISKNHEAPYAFSVEYSDIFSANINKTEKMFKTLRAIDRKYNTMVKKLGTPDSFGAFVAFIANCVKVKTGIFYKNQINSRYDDCEFIFHDMDLTKSHINHLTDKLLHELNPEPVHAVA